MRWSVFLVVAAVTSACASGGGGSAVYRREIGNASLNDVLSRSRLILNRYQYEVLEQDSLPFVRIETHWRERRPFEDETAMGITEAETRLIISARARAQTDLGGTYNIRLTMENRVRLMDAPEWNEKTNTTMFQRYADEVTAEFRKEISDIGVRRY